MDIDHGSLRTAFGHFPSGVVAVAAAVNGQPVGLAASTFVGVSLQPPLVAICVQNASATWPQLVDRPSLGLSLIAETQAGAVRTLAAKTGDRFAGLRTVTTGAGAILIEGACLWLETRVHQLVQAGDHVVAILAIDAIEPHSNGSPIVFHGSRLRRLAEDDSDRAESTR